MIRSGSGPGIQLGRQLVPDPWGSRYGGTY